MKSFTNGKLLGTDVAAESLEVDGWEEPITKESPQTIRSIGRIDQLEAGHADVRKKLRQIYQILNYLKASQLASTKSAFPTPHLSWHEAPEDVDILFDFEEDLSLWERAQLAIKPIGPAIDQIEPPYHKKLSKVTKLFGEMEEDFADIARRMTRCAVLEEELATFEDSLEDDETENLASCVSLIRDVLDYNYAEHLTRTHLELLKKAIGLIRDKGLECSEEDYQNLHNEFLQSGLALLPTSRKAIEKYEPTKSNG